MQTYGYIDQKCKATISLYAHNFQTVTSKLLETKLETNEAIKEFDISEEKERAKPTLLQLESKTSEQTLTDDTLKESTELKITRKDSATLSLHAIEPCAPLSNLPEEHYGEIPRFAFEKVNVVSCILLGFNKGLFTIVKSF